MGRAQRPRPARLAVKLLQIRHGLCLSQRQMLLRLDYERSKLTVGHISDFERDKREPPLQTLLRYAEAAGIPLELIIDDRQHLPQRLPSDFRQLLDKITKGISD